MDISKSKIDKSGLALAKRKYKDELELIELEEVFDEYRKAHLRPLSETTIEIQRMLTGYGSSYYIAQRLKRKPQIIRKLNRLSVRLTQLQDIGGCRIIVPKNRDVDEIFSFLKRKSVEEAGFVIEKATDYREKGRDDTGYRSLHVIMNRSDVKIELQVRSRIQHYWAESIERTSVIYGHYLKEKDGDPKVIDYFKGLSDIFYEIEAGREPSSAEKIKIDTLRQSCEQIIADSDRNNIFDSFVNEGVIKTLVEKESKRAKGLNNWILIFDWNQGAFVSWDIVGQDPDEAVSSYIYSENMYPAEDGFEVVLVGASEIMDVRQTHSHYFGIETYSNILESLDSSIVGFARKIDIDVGARQILACLYRKHFWGKKTVSENTLKNHFCSKVMTFDSSLESLIIKSLVIQSGGYSLNISKKSEIEQYL
ncbi:(p)ppGpp synthetase [Chromobacterium violaceum]|uniref:RelA/SpoT domain-containing protein n=1 Tax=Chromobacterium violaceum TaxID=536 RepID=UPI0009DB1CF1|nr:RelA/SpoT domain-containing protein [Chromobacterium violaceum]OQS08531.1 (p)ppGpp synthetase [Chromobacterium violaceum]OQS21984.1 (p)ppGpp synthetase [Chromobacterium violaceum]